MHSLSTFNALRNKPSRLLHYFLLGFMAVLLTACDLFSDGRVEIPSSIISMIPPEGYSLSERFPGLEDTSVDGSFTVNTFPSQSGEALGELFGSRERAEPTLNNRGIHVEGVETISFNGQDVLLFRGRQNDSEGVTYEKWIGVFIEGRPVMVAFQEPRPGKLSKKTILETFASIKFNLEQN